MNKGCWTNDDEFLKIDSLSEYLSLEQLCLLDDKTLEAKLSSLFFYIGHDKIWKWRIQALRAMAYEYKPKYLPYIQNALNNDNELIREMAKWVLETIQNEVTSYAL